MTATAIASKIAHIMCTHKNSKHESCRACVTNYTNMIITLGIHVVKEAAAYFEPNTPQEKITPITWCNAYEISKVVLEADRR